MWVWGIIFVIAGILIGVSLVGSAAGMATLTDMDPDIPTLTCFHCGNQTEVGRHHCQHCKKELQ
jgi:hypothetical protein